MSAREKTQRVLNSRFLCLLLSLILIPTACFSFVLVNVSASEVFSWDEVDLYNYYQHYDSSWITSSLNTGGNITYSGSFRSIVRFGLRNVGSPETWAKIPVGSDKSDVLIYSRISYSEIDSLSSTRDLCFVVEIKCYDSEDNQLSSVLKWVFPENNTAFISISGIELPSNTHSFSVIVGFGSQNESDVADKTDSSLYGVYGSYTLSCALSVKTSDGSFVSDNWGSDSVYPFYFSHEGQNVYLEKGGRIDLCVLARGFSDIDIHVIARTITDNTKYDLYYFGSFHMVLLSAVPPDTDEAVILCFDYYIDGNLVYTSPACAIYFSGWVSGNPGDGSGGSVADGEILDYLEEVKMTQSEANDKLDALQASVEELPDQMDQAMQNAADKEKNDASSQGSDLVDQLTGVIPDYSEGFTTALTDFASNFSYDGTEAILRIPQIRFPEIPSNSRGAPLVRSFVMLEEREVDFSEFAAMMPESVLTLVRCLLTVALIIFCFKELYDTISYILTLRKGDN